jgi:ribosomal-protein-alanine N-acetyltransferase
MYIKDMNIRPMNLEDIPQVSEIEREAFPPPWPPTNFKRDLDVNSLTYYMVAYTESHEVNRDAPNVNSALLKDRESQSKFQLLVNVTRSLFMRENTSKAMGQFILGFAGLWFMADEAHLANIAVRERYREKGVGERLLISVIELAIKQNARFITLEVRSSNKAAQALYRKYGFAEVGTRREYYTDNKEDAILMTVDDITSISFQDKLLDIKKATIPMR